MVLRIQDFFDSKTFTMTYVVFDADTLDAVIIDPVLDYESATGVVRKDSANKLIEFVLSEKLKVHFVLETHAHADHLSSSQYLKSQWPQLKIAMTERITKVQSVFGPLFGDGFRNTGSGSDFDLLLADAVTFNAGSIPIKVLDTSGHTPACSTFVIGENLFTGDLIFMPDSGTGRCDFPGGDASQLFDSVSQIYSFPEHYSIYVGHDYQPEGRPLRFQTSVGEQKQSNIHIFAGQTKEAFIALRQERDITLAAPKLLLPSLQVNIRAGKLPEAEANGQRYLKIPIREQGNEGS